MRVSLNTYGTMPYVAIAIEFVFSLACIAWYQFEEKRRGRPMPLKQLAALYAVFIVGIVMWIPSATVSLRDQLHAVGIAI